MPLYLAPLDNLEPALVLSPVIVEFIEARAAFHLSLPMARQAERFALDAMELGEGILAMAREEQRRRDPSG